MISHLEPTSVFSFFEEICSIPHGSYHTNLIADYMVNFAKERNLEYSRDGANNVIIKKPASPDCNSDSTVILQGHLDMVCAKEDGVEIDFEKDGLTLECDGEYISAKGTTLGGDDGIAVAMALAILDSDSVTHPALECVFTTDEEVGMLGAAVLDTSQLTAAYMINIDSEEEGQFTVSCAGGETLIATMPVSVSDKAYEHTLKLKITGLLGGHSGIEIDKGRANANILMGRLLKELTDATDLQLVSVNGGQKDNAIAPECEAVININDCNAAVSIAEALVATFKKEYPVEENLKIIVEETEPAKGLVCNVIPVLSTVTNGIRTMSKEIEGLVQTSSNLGVVRTEEDNITMNFSLRSSVEAEKRDMHEEIEALVKSYGGTTESAAEYPAWEYKKDSRLRDTCVKIYTKQYGQEPEIVAIHAGLECGIFSGKMKGLDCISYGPNLTDVHTPGEKMEIASVKRVFEFTKELLRVL